ncbi:unnamed protein product [Vitrella brassicaformis CCMP3155]|uniref:RRM domain-containing protein n=1 Tax=Vitrella brassicaformis (strain CCMP3155) TaxID=1169540 RepID=A0A0G4GGT4_VITBC|nr:unnamed protein product [Vitrella brassicaformis CCMP3155]|eukprot:CEM28661.1 unnamed protein product [Vitrella brassicaformis CCMP3155]
MCTSEPSEVTAHGELSGEVAMGRGEMRRLLSPLGKMQLVELLVTLGDSIPAARREIYKVASQTRAHRRLYVKNLSYRTTTESLLQAFNQFGPIEEGVIVTDPFGRSKGYGFVTFRSADAARVAIQRPVDLDGRRLTVGLASDPLHMSLTSSSRAAGQQGESASSSARGAGPGRTAAGYDENHITMRKLFIRNLNTRTTNDSLRKAFEDQGDVEDASVLYDRYGKSKGFGFVTFVSSESASHVLLEPQRVIDGQMAFIHLAAERDIDQRRSSPQFRPDLSPHSQPVGRMDAPLGGTDRLSEHSFAESEGRMRGRMFTRRGRGSRQIGRFGRRMPGFHLEESADMQSAHSAPYAPYPPPVGGGHHRPGPPPDEQPTSYSPLPPEIFPGSGGRGGGGVGHPSSSRANGANDEPPAFERRGWVPPPPPSAAEMSGRPAMRGAAGAQTSASPPAPPPYED